MIAKNLLKEIEAKKAEIEKQQRICNKMKEELEDFDMNNLAWTDYQFKLYHKIEDLEDEISYLHGDLCELKRQLKRGETPLTAFA